MRKVHLLLLAGASAFALDACSEKTEEDAKEVAATASAEAVASDAADAEGANIDEAGQAEKAVEPAEDFLAGAWDAENSKPILDKTLYLHLDFDEAALSENERAAAKELIAAGERFHDLYLDQRHSQARAAEAALANLRGRQDLKDLFWMMKGPIATTLDNQRAPFLNVEAETPGKNVYPANATRDELDAFIAAHPGRKDELLDLRAIVREARYANVADALGTLDKYPALDRLHPDLRAQLQASEDYIGVPFSVAYADDVMFIYDRLNAAADLVAEDDQAFARFLRLRGRDLLSDNYDGGDAQWVTGHFAGNLNAQIGSYETYDDALYGVKSFFSLSLLQRDKAKSDELKEAVGDIQSIEDELPYEARKRVRADIPVGVYNVIADFGQSRGTNTATILPNEGHLSRQYGRTILIRSNILRNEVLFEESLKAFRAAVADVHADDLGIDGSFYRTLFHEVGHYLGPDQTKDGGDIDAALQDTADLMEEMKADLVSLFSAPRLAAKGLFTNEQLHSIYAGGILRVVQKNKPRRDQPYQTMQLIQWNWFLDHDVLTFADGKLAIDYDAYPAAVEGLLAKVIDLQYQGDRDAANAFVDQWTGWDDNLHGVIAQNMKDAERARYRLVTYEALGQEAR